MACAGLNEEDCREGSCMQVGTKAEMGSIADGSMWAACPSTSLLPEALLPNLGFSDIRYALPVDSMLAQTITSIRAFVQGNQRVVCRQTYDGDLAELFSAQGATRYPRNMVRASLFACNWLQFDYLRFCTSQEDSTPQAALGWQIILDGNTAQSADLRGTYRTTYAAGIVPVTQWVSSALECAVFALAPQDQSARIGGALYALRIRNRASEPLQGTILLGGPGDVRDGCGASWDETANVMRCRGRTMLGHSEAHVIIAPRGRASRVIKEGETRIKWDLSLPPGQCREFSVSIAMADCPERCEQEIEKLESLPVGSWLQRTVDSCRSSIQRLDIKSGEWWVEFLTNHLHRGTNALRVDHEGCIVGAAVAPEMVTETVNREDLFRGMQVHSLLAPEVFRRFVVFSCRSLAPPPGVPFTENTAPNVHLPIVAEAYYRATADQAFFLEHPEIGRTIEDLLQRLLAYRGPSRWLFPAEEVSDGHPLKEYDFCTNVQIWRAFTAAARVVGDVYGKHSLAEQYERIADLVRADVLDTMTVDGVFGPQFAAATDLRDTICFMDGEDDVGALAPYFGFCEFSDVRWRNYCRYGFSEHNPIYDPETGGLVWIDDPNIGHTIGTPAAPSFASRLAAAVTRDEAAEEMRRVRSLADIDTTFYWYPVSRRVPGGLCHSLWMTGSASRVILSHYLGLDVDVPARRLTFKPWSPWHSFKWERAQLGAACFSLDHVRGTTAHASMVANHNDEPWWVTLGFYVPPGRECDAIIINEQLFQGEMEEHEHFEEKLIIVRAIVGAGQSLRATARLRRSVGKTAHQGRQA
jgi:hypothetical protein